MKKTTTKNPLGKGLGALIPTEKPDGGYIMLPIERISPNSSQPRKEFKPESIEDLAESIREKGIIQPLVLRKNEDGYEIIAGERRWRAAQKAGLRRVPAIIKDVDARESLEIALVENLQREDLNPIDEAMAYEKLIEDFGLTHEDISLRIGKDRSTITNQLRLLRLPKEAKDALVKGEITPGHARALLSLQSPKKILELLEAIRSEKLSVRKTEQLVHKSMLAKKPKSEQESLSPYLSELGDRLRHALGTQIRIVDKGGKGKIEIEYYSNEELQRLIDILARKDKGVFS